MAYVIGISGGSGSGKTYFCHKLINNINGCVISQDAYYKDFKELSLGEKKKINFDHPSSIDSDLLCNDLDKLIKGQAIDCPVYDFKTSSRLNIKNTILASNIILLEGLFLFCIEELFQKLDLSIFLDVNEDVRITRRLNRDLKERGRSIEDTKAKLNDYVLPMHDIFIEPYKTKADFSIKNNNTDLKQEAQRLTGVIKKRNAIRHNDNSLIEVNM